MGGGDGQQAGAQKASRIAVGNDAWAATAIAVIAVLLAAVLFQTSALSFDYMKLRGFPIYGSGASLPQFAKTVHEIKSPDVSTVKAYRKLLRDREFGDLDRLSAAATVEKLVAEARKITGLDALAPTFPEIEQRYAARCAPGRNEEAIKLMANAGLERPPAAAAIPPLLPDDVCAIAAPSCSETASPQGSVRYRLICAEAARQKAAQQKKVLEAVTIDSARYYADALRLTYPDFEAAKAPAAIRIAEAYSAAACPNVPRCDTSSKDHTPAPKDGAAKGAAADHPAGKPADQKTCFWQTVLNFWLGWPLAILYLMLAAIFGVMGSLARYLYQIANPSTEAYGGVQFPALAGGGAAMLVLVIVMGGFQFLAAGTAPTDVAYPNPITVCGLAVLSGLAGEKVLTSIQAFIARLFP